VQVPVSHKIKDELLWLSADKALFIESQQALVLSDLHLGKTGHFRKSGIAVPQNIYTDDLHRLLQLVHYFQPKQMIVVGDLFHSVANKELALFQKWRESFSQVEVILIKGNHDILHQQWYDEAGIQTRVKKLVQHPFQFVHDSNELSKDDSAYAITGHIHPGIVMKGLGKQSLRLPCFYFSDKYAVLPAFGGFTGLHMINHQKSDAVFAIINQNVVQVQ